MLFLYTKNTAQKVIHAEKVQVAKLRPRLYLWSYPRGKGTGVYAGKVQASCNKTFIKTPVVVGGATVNNFFLSFSDAGRIVLSSRPYAFFHWAVTRHWKKALFFSPSPPWPRGTEKFHSNEVTTRRWVSASRQMGYRTKQEGRRASKERKGRWKGSKNFLTLYGA